MTDVRNPHSSTSGLVHTTIPPRCATESDLSAILAIEQVSFPLPWTEEAFRSEFRNPCSHIWVVEEEGRIVGYACAWFIQDEGQVVNVAVLPQYRRHRVGRALIQHLMSEAHLRGVRTLSLEVRKSNEAALALYASFGFHKVAVRKRYYEHTEDAIVMTCAVPAC